MRPTALLVACLSCSGRLQELQLIEEGLHVSLCDECRENCLLRTPSPIGVFTALLLAFKDAAAGWKANTQTSLIRKKACYPHPVMQLQVVARNRSLAIEGSDKPRSHPDPHRMPHVAIVGRPNVGKSTLANRMLKGDDPVRLPSITYDKAGTTRDTVYGYCCWNGRDFMVMDTGGLTFDEKVDDGFQREINQQVTLVMEEAQVVMFVVDGQQGPTQLDEDVASFLRKINLPIVLAVNKCESPGFVDAGLTKGMMQALDFWSLGLGNPWPVSGIHGNGVGDLLDELVNVLPSESEDERDARELHDDSLRELRVAILGQPNMGKSSLLNQLLGKQRAIVSNISGTTRDTISDSIVHDGIRFTFIDTAGARMSAIGKDTTSVEKLMEDSAARAIVRADVCLLVIDARSSLGTQLRLSRSEDRLAKMIAKKQRPCVVVNNKWDLVPVRNNIAIKESTKYLNEYLPQDIMNWTEPLYISAKTGLRTGKVFKAVLDAFLEYERRNILDAMENFEEGRRFLYAQRFEHQKDQRQRFALTDEEIDRLQIRPQIRFNYRKDLGCG